MITAQQRHYFFRLQISHDQFLHYYQGVARTVQIMSECGKRLRLPAAKLRPMLAHNGIHGRYCLTVDADKRFISLSKINS